MNSIVTIFLIAIGLAMDAFAVSIGNGIILKEVKIKDALKTGIFFGGFQALMPVIGWFCGMAFSKYITSIDHWIAFGLLVLIGGNMIKESFSNEDENQEKKDPNNLKVLLVMAIATSIDALAVGVSFAMVGTHITIPAIMIGVITFIISFIGVFIGKRAGEVFEKKAELVGGIILIAIGIKIVLEHMALL